MTDLERLEELQQGLELVMDAVKKGDLYEAERLLYVVGRRLDELLHLVRRG